MEHLLRDIKDTTIGSLSQRVTNQLTGLRGLSSQLSDIRNYLKQVLKAIPTQEFNLNKNLNLGCRRQVASEPSNRVSTPGHLQLAS